jgi:hypothetical protein
MEGGPVHPVTAKVMSAAILPAKKLRTLKTVAVIGLLVTVMGWFVSPERTSAAVLIAAMAVLGVALGGLLFVAFGYVMRAGWSVAFRRVPEAMAGLVPFGVACTAIALAGAPVLYHWMHDTSHDPLLAKKAAWLNGGFFFVRAAIIAIVWIWFARRIRRVSLAQDASKDVAATGRNLRNSTLFLVCFALTFSVASFDWIMSIEAHWFSTVFAVYCFSGVFVSGLAVITIMSILLRRRGVFANVLRDDHLHDLGKLTLGFTTFWAYIWFCQYMLIWYSNLPEETSYYITRFTGAWGPLMIANVMVGWFIPFVILLPRPAKRNETIMLGVAALLLVGRVFDLVLLIQPGILDGPRFGVWEIGALAALVPVALILLMRTFESAPPVPSGDPMLAESLHYHN